MTRLTCRIRSAENGRGKRSPSRDFLRVVIKWPFSQDGPGSPVSPGSNRKVVGPSAPWLPNGTIRTESTRSLILRESSDTTKTQWRTVDRVVSVPQVFCHVGEPGVVGAVQQQAVPPIPVQLLDFRGVPAHDDRIR